MSERGNKLNRLIDRYVGIPLTVPAFVFRRIDKIVGNRLRSGVFTVAQREFSFNAKSASRDSCCSVAIICLGAIGDLLLLSGLILSIKAKYPTAYIGVYTTQGNASAGELLPDVDAIHSFSLSDIVSLMKSLRGGRYDIVIDSTQWARLGALVSAFSGASCTVGFRTAGQLRSLAYDINVPHSRALHEWRNFLQLGKGAGIVGSEVLPLIPPVDSNLQDIFNKISVSSTIPHLDIFDAESEKMRQFMVFHMCAAGSNATQRMWGEANWINLIEVYASKGYLILLSGSPADSLYISEFISSSISGSGYKGAVRSVINIAGLVSLKELAALFRRAVAVVSVNTGPMHLASLVGAPTVGLNGPTDPLRWGAVGVRAVSLCPMEAEEMLHLGFESVSPKSNSSNIQLSDVIEAVELLISKN